MTAVSGNHVTVSPGVYMPNWRSSQQPQVWWWAASATMNGIEGMTVDHTGSPATTGIGFHNAYNGWVKNVKSLNAKRNHVWLNQAARIEVRDSYFFGTQNAAVAQLRCGALRHRGRPGAEQHLPARHGPRS